MLIEICVSFILAPWAIAQLRSQFMFSPDLHANTTVNADDKDVKSENDRTHQSRLGILFDHNNGYPLLHMGVRHQMVEELDHAQKFVIPLPVQVQKAKKKDVEPSIEKKR
jgi:hypothetical protein